MTARTTQLLIVAAAFAVGLASVLAVVLLVSGRMPAPIATTASAVGGPFRLVDQNGRTVTDGDLEGRPFLVFFGFTHCPDVCPTTLFEVSEVLRTLCPEVDGVSALF